MPRSAEVRVIRDHQGKPTGEVQRAGEYFIVLRGSDDDPGIVFLRQSDGERCTWDDNAEIYDWFEVLQVDA
jgi:hypothetical protein